MSGSKFVVICIDSLRRDHCPGFGTMLDELPTLRGLGESSARFRNAISPSVWTHPVHASLFTGYLPPEHGLHGGAETLTDTRTFGEILSDAGYDAHLFSSAPWLDHGGITRGFDKHLEFYPGADGLGKIARIGRRAAGRAASPDDLVVNAAVPKLREMTDESLVFVHLNEVHHPYEPSTPHHRTAGLSRLGTARSLYRQIDFFDRYSIFGTDAAKSVDDGFLEALRKAYRGCVSEADDHVGELLDAAPDDATIILYADHGENLGEDGTFSHHYSVSDELIRVPLFVRDPEERIERGDHDQIVLLHDLFETVLSMAGVDPPERSTVDLRDGRDAAFVDFRPEPDAKAGVESELPPERRRPHHQQCVWTPDDKMVRYPGSGEVEGDERLLDTYEAYASRFEELAVGDGESITGDVERRLQDLGYR